MSREDLIELIEEREGPEGLVRTFSWNGERYDCINRTCTSEDTRILLQRILKQAMVDYFRLKGKEALRPEEQEAFRTATEFLFNDNLCIDYGGKLLSLRDILEYLVGDEPNMRIFREGILRRKSLPPLEVQEKESSDDDL